MAKISIPVPDAFNFSTEVTVLIQHINRADHLANEHLVALLNEARSRYYHELAKKHEHMDFREFINADLAVIYKSEAHYGDNLKIELATDDFNRYGCDFVFRITQSNSGQLVAIAKTAMLRFDYAKNRLKPVADNFRDIFQD